MTGQYIPIMGRDGEFSTCRTVPAGARGSRVLVFHEIFGVNNGMRRTYWPPRQSRVCLPRRVSTNSPAALKKPTDSRLTFSRTH